MSEELLWLDSEYEELELPDEEKPSCLKTDRKASVLITVTVLTLFLSMICGWISGYFAVRRYLTPQLAVAEVIPLSETEVVPDVTVGNTVPVQTGVNLTAAQVYAANVNSTVGITTSISTNYWGYRTTAAASGSGFLISEDGYIVTNYHVIEDASSITVALYDGKTFPAELIGYDESNDIAVLKVDTQGLSHVTLGDSDSVNVGDSVVAIGNPLGELTFSLTGGLVSAVNREVTLSSSLTMNLLQTDCAINSGNSGGPLFNMSGEVIGVTNAKYSSSGKEASIDNIGFAIPVNSIRTIVESIIEKGYSSKPYIGVSVLDVSELATESDLPSGIFVQSVLDDSPAAQAGLQVGDVITAINGEPLGSDALVELVASSAVGDSLSLEVYRQEQVLEITLTIGEKIQSEATQTSTDPLLSEDPELIPRNRKSGRNPSAKGY